MKKKNPILVVVLIIVMLAFILGPIFKEGKHCKNIKQVDQPFNSKSNVVEEPVYTFHAEGNLHFINKTRKSSINIEIEVADNFKDRMVGLMYRKKMKDDRGMLFIFDEEGPQSFWMKNTYLPLDIIYVNDDYHIVDIYPNTTPLSEISLPSKSPSIYVVETVAGFTNYHNIKIGDSLKWEIY